MKKITYLLLKLFSPKVAAGKPADNKRSAASFYDLKLQSIEGKEIDFSIYKNKKVLLVNTASECGYTPQYDELQHLHQKHGSKIAVLGFPSNDFGAQEPGANEAIGAFCRKNFGVTFQLFEKSTVVADDKNPVYQWLTEKEKNGWNDQKPNWNFCKYLVNENGELVNFYSSAVNPLSDDILKQL